jgi:hypothetical protein
MTTDRELLEAAAKAAGLKIHAARQAERDEEGCANSGLWIVNGSTCWNPLTSDGDALRLAVKLDLNVIVNRVDERTTVEAGYSPAMDGRRRFIEYYDDADPYAATRRAIVRAAAEIGRSKE